MIFGRKKEKTQAEKDEQNQASPLKYKVNDLDFLPAANWGIFKRILTYIKPYWLFFLISAIATGIASLLDAYLISMLSPVLDKGLGKSLNSDYLKIVAFGLLGIVIFRAILLFVSGYLISYASSKIVTFLRLLVFKKFLKMPRDFFDETGIGVLQNRLNGDIGLMMRLSGGTLITLVRDGFYALGLIGVMFYNSWKLSLVIFITMPIILMIVIYVSYKFKQITRIMMRNNSILLQKSIEMLRNHNIVRNYSGVEFENARFSEVNHANRQSGMKMTVVGQVSSSLIVVLASVSLSVMIYLSSYPVLFGAENTITPGQFTVVFAAMFSLSKPIRSLTSINADVQIALTAADKVFITLDLQEETDVGTYAPETVNGEIELKNVNFRYFNVDKTLPNILNNINIKFPAGKITALVGKSGSGKSTLVSLLSRLYEIDSGEIFLDGVNLNDYKLHNLRQQISIVSQNTELFNDTIYNNIVYCDGHKYTYDQVMDAAKRSHVYEFIKGLPDGLHTMIGDSGLRLSGGQRQRLSIARALLRNTPIIILDEATSALDTESERYIKRSIDELQNKTLIVIAHRLSTIENADNIVVMDSGMVIEQGTHDELIKLNKAYANLHKMQFSIETAEREIQEQQESMKKRS